MENEILVLMVLSPSEEISNDVHQIKSDIGRMIGDFGARKSKAHITIRPSEYRSRTHTPNFLNELERILKQMPPIQLSTDGFEGFPGNGLIFIKLEMNEYVKTWFDMLNYKVLNGRKIMPHITIAKGLSADDFEKVWPLLSERTYRRQFVVNHLLILDRDLDSGNCTPIKKIYFCNPDQGLSPASDLFTSPPGLFPTISPIIFS